MIYQKEINSYADLEEFIRDEIRVQINAGNKKVEIKLCKKWFTKLYELIVFFLKNERIEPITKECKAYQVKINNVNTIIKLYDL